MSERSDLVFGAFLLVAAAATAALFGAFLEIGDRIAFQFLYPDRWFSSFGSKGEGDTRS